MKVSFDFDGTLDRQDIQTLAKMLVKSEYDVFVVTCRYNVDGPIKFENRDLWEVVNKVGIKRENVYFTGMCYKWETLKMLNIDHHYDDCKYEVRLIEENTNIKAIRVYS